MSSPKIIANQDVVNVFFDVGPDLGIGGWQLVEKAGWEWLAVPPENRNQMFSASNLQTKPPGLTDAEWEALLDAFEPLYDEPPEQPPVDIPPIDTPPPDDETPLRDITHQEVINAFYAVGPDLGMDGWQLIEKAGWQFVAVPPENRDQIFDPANLDTKPPNLTDPEWDAISAAIQELRLEPEVEKPTWPDWWPWEKALVGLHGRGDGVNRDIDFQRFRTARIEAAKFKSRAAENGVEAARHVQEAHAARALSSTTTGPTPIIINPMYNFPHNPWHPRDSGFPISPQTFANDVANQMRAFAAQSNNVLWLVEIHNEPNSYVEGFAHSSAKGSWTNGFEFSEWWFEVRDLLEPTMPAGTKWGYPGLSPGGASEFRGMSERQFFEQSEAAWKAADWVGAHSYWQTPQQMIDRSFGYSWQWILETSGKPVAITEFANTFPLNLASKRTKAEQYVEYYRLLRNVEGLLGAYSFIVSHSGSEWSEQKWSEEMAQIVGARNF